MKIKKKDLRKGLAQLPINYPDPDVLPEALPGGAIDLDTELVAVELLCKRLAHNEVVVRDAVLAEIPRYLARVTEAMSEMEQDYAAEIEDVSSYFAAHPKRSNPYLYHNLPRALQQFRERAQQDERKESRRDALRALRAQREQERLERENAGRYGAAVVSAASASDSSDDEADGSRGGARRRRRRTEDGDAGAQTANEHRERYAAWMAAWCDLELVFLKLCRGLHYCLWHSDKPLVQLECAQRIANLLEAPSTDRCKILFYGSLLRVLSREWRTIDRYRMDKYMALVRKMLAALFTFVKDIEAKEVVVATTAAVIEANRATPSAPSSAKSSPTKTRARKAPATAKPGRKRTAAEAAAEEEEADEEGAAEDRTGSSSTPNARAEDRVTAFTVSEKVLGESYAEKPVTARCLREIFFIFGVQIVPIANSIGMTMHICDVVFDELNRAALPVELFLAFSAGIPLYAMSQNNFVEKRVLDHFFPPIAGGVLAAKREEQLKETMVNAEKRRSRAKRSAETEADMDAVASTAAAEQTNRIVRGLASQCQLFSVVPGTSRLVRVMFTEAELVLRQTADPDSYMTLSKVAQHRRLEHELEEVNETRRRVREERTATRQIGKQNKYETVKKKVKALKSDSAAKGKKVDEKALKKQVISEERENKKKSKKVVRDTKRKKNYTLTKKDLASDDDE